MLHWRLLIGIPLVAFLLTLCWFDARAALPGVLIMPFFLMCVFFLCREIIQLLHAGGIYPRRSTVYLGIFGTIILCWISCYNTLPIVERLEKAFQTSAVSTSREYATESEPELERRAEVASRDLDAAARSVEAAREALSAAEEALNSAREHSVTESQPDTVKTVGLDRSRDGDVTESEWRTAAFAGVHILLAIAFGVLIAFIGEMLRFKQPGGNIINLSGAVFAIVYIGLLGSFMVMLRIAYGIAAVVSMIIVTKLCDIGAYTVGRLIGRHKMAPSLSPGKTIEGICGGLAFSIAGAWASVQFLFPYATGSPSQTTWFGIILYGVLVGGSGAIGDLAESLIKRDVMRKDSGTNVPGFGGFLDIFDSLLIAAPVAFGLWAFHVVQ